MILFTFSDLSHLLSPSITIFFLLIELSFPLPPCLPKSCMMQVKALKLPLRTGMPTQAYGLVNVIVIDGGSNCKRGFGTSGYRVERRSLSDFDFVLLKGHG